MPQIKHVLIGLLCLALGLADALGTNTATQNKLSESTDAEPSSESTEAVKETTTQQGDSSSESDASNTTIQSVIQCHPENGAIIFDFRKQTVLVEEHGLIEYGTTKIEAENMVFDWGQRTITAASKKNEQGTVEKKAVLTLDRTEYIATAIRYHLDSQRSVATTLFTKQDDGLLRSDRVKKDRENIFYGNQGIYTTCNLTHPHFYIATAQFKFIQEERVISGPFRLYFDGVRTPLGLPFGLFLLPQKSGIIAPQYAGLDTEKGFGLTDGGYYFHFNDYTDLTLQGDIYSRLTASLRADFRYKKRYRYGGNLFYQGNWDRHSTSPQKSWRFKWKHNTENNRTSSFNADVELESTSFKDFYAAHNKKASQQRSSSNIHYTNTLVGLPYKLDAKLKYYYTATGKADTRKETATLPELYLKTNKIYPFRKKRGLDSAWYSDIYFEHRFDFTNKLSNEEGERPLTFFSHKDWKELFENKEYAAQNKFPLRTNIKLFNYLSLTPEASCVERWYGKRYTYADDNYIAEVIHKEQGFFRVYSYNFGGKLETALYGTYLFPSASILQAIRHEVQPTLNFVYTPDFSKGQYEYFQAFPHGNKRYRFNSIYGSLENRATACLTVALNNTLTAKIKRAVKGEERTQKIPILKSFNWNADYDFLKEKHYLSDIKLNTGTSILDELITLSLKTTFDPYLYEQETGDNDQKKYVKREDFAWQHGQGLPYIGNIKDATVNIGCRLGPLRRSGFLSLFKKEDDRKKADEQETEENDAQKKSEAYTSFMIPWGLRLDYTLKYTNPNYQQFFYRSAQDKPTKQHLDINGEFDLTENWKAVIRTTYDITKRRLQYEDININITRDLHCWEMKFECQPWGDREYYAFNIGVKSPLLQFMKYSRKRGANTQW